MTPSPAGTASVTALKQTARIDRAERAATAARNRADRNLGGLAALLATRPDLRGVHAPADLAEETIRWSA